MHLHLYIIHRRKKNHYLDKLVPLDTHTHTKKYVVAWETKSTDCMMSSQTANVLIFRGHDVWLASSVQLDLADIWPKSVQTCRTLILSYSRLASTLAMRISIMAKWTSMCCHMPQTFSMSFYAQERQCVLVINAGTLIKSRGRSTTLIMSALPMPCQSSSNTEHVIQKF